MKSLTTTIFKLALLSVAASQIIIGAIACIPGIQLGKLAEIFYKASLETTPQLEHISHMFGVYMLVIGILAVFALLNPIKNRAITYGIIVLLVLRVLQRVVFAQEALRNFKIPVGWYWAQTSFFLGVAVVLFLFSPKEESPK